MTLLMEGCYFEHGARFTTGVGMKHGVHQCCTGCSQETTRQNIRGMMPIVYDSGKRHKGGPTPWQEKAYEPFPFVTRDAGGPQDEDGGAAKTETGVS